MSLRHLSLWVIAAVALSGHAIAASTALPFKQEDATASFPALGELIILLFAAVLILLAVSIMLKRKRGSNQKWLDWLVAGQDGDALNIVSSKRVTAGTSLHIVEWEGGKLLVAVNNHSTVKLAELPVTMVPAAIKSGGES